MPFFLFLALLSLSSFATEVATLDANKSTNEVLLVLTDESLSQSMDKSFVSQKCKFRFSTNISYSVREFYFPRVCRAHVVKFLMDSGYKPDQFFQNFTK